MNRLLNNNKTLLFNTRNQISFNRYYIRAPFDESLIKSSFDPKNVELNKYKFWEDHGLFKPKENKNGEKFSMVLPPPNVTGSLHIGHSLTTTIQDSLVRYNRMLGKEVVWIPGLDHSGIATQVAVEKQLLVKEKKTRYDLGREKFLEKVFEWTEIYSKNINNQLRITGSSLDWSRSVFTLDQQRNNAVQEAFIRLFNMGLIYRSTRLVNWCPQLQSVISDIEIDHQQIEKPTSIKLKSRVKSIEVGVIYDVAYQIDNSDSSMEQLKDLIVSTTRPETIFGDTGIAIHPEDERYKSYHGRFAVHPFTQKRIPIVLDPILVDKTLGTGVVKITPGHDFNDYQCGTRHSLEFINIMNSNGTLNENTIPEFNGVDRLDARPLVIKKLEEKGLYHGKKPHPTTLSICSRSGDLLEPILKPQWYVDCKAMASRSVGYVEKDEIKIVPESFKENWFRWLNNIQDWCISRQLWWGNPIPAYLIIENNLRATDNNDGNNSIINGMSLVNEKWVVAKTEEEAAEIAIKNYNLKKGEFTLEKDQDVLDTWFSSGLFPISSLGWPNEKESIDFKKYFPLDVMETGSDILFFWVARMVMLCSTLVPESPIPFNSILLHPMIRDSQGRKMSKSLGNVIDPLNVINGITLKELKDNVLSSNLTDKEKSIATKGLDKEFPQGIPQCGTDSLRLSLSQYPINGKDINLDINKIIGIRLFCNKLWNASKLVLSNCNNIESIKPITMYYNGNTEPFDYNSITLIDKWILTRLSKLIESSNSNFNSFNLSTISQSLYSFFQYDFCDLYLECIKVELNRNNESSKMVLINVLDTYLRLLHPFMPFITEDIWQRLPRASQMESLNCEQTISIMVSEYPTTNYKYHKQYLQDEAKIEKEISLFQSVLHATRAQRSLLTIHDKTKVNVTLHVDADSFRDKFNINLLNTFEQLKDSFEKIANASLVISGQIISQNQINESNGKITTIADGLQIQIEFDSNENNQFLNPAQSQQSQQQSQQALQSKITKLESFINDLEKTINSQDFKQRVPLKVQEQKIDKLNKYKIELNELLNRK
ncbi:hypothetical protein DICPUDRAFT_159231 [Dictyostelium purpureum]|uniref:valine--tRNA ligase n=1 Tax=Dictyostelium purpureum TaxID=5786 RepID=F1A3L6_DICPU|nr:uncharacterized protein DICPUDRAFT_159231 [Dictyostelium purpureum]EGC29212.1 hypothetical protein DICPUDRAFT_159231 [Dictyostelium purpureum]|eukprot:XP_003294258.1 hypothetical protein DICPUDRAFT_159231 [Dictyostelium purpureum]